MKRSLLTLACTGFLLATSINSGSAQVGGPYVYNPTPSPQPETSDAPRGGGFRLSLPKVKGSSSDPRIPHTPEIVGARMVNGYVRFSFKGGGPARLKFNIVWSRPGKANVTDMRWAKKWVETDHTAQGTERAYKINNAIEEYIINERALPDTVYAFHVQVQGKDQMPGSDGKYSYPLSKFVSLSFRTPAGPSMADKIKIAAKYGDTVVPAKSPSPYGGTKVKETPRLKPGPIIGKTIYSSSTPIVASGSDRAPKILNAHQELLVQPALSPRLSSSPGIRLK